MKRIFRPIFATLVLLIVLTSMFGLSRFIRREAFRPEIQKGMCYTTWSKKAYGTTKSDKSLEKLKEINVNWVAIVTTWYQDTCFSMNIFPTGKTSSDESVKRAIEKARSLGMKVMVKPHLDLLSTAEGSWRGEIACVKEPEWQVWFNDYKKFTLHYAKIAEETGAEMFCVGTELTATTVGHENEWREIISAVKEVYNGDLTYAANWSDEYLQIRFWDALDYAGIDAYFPLSDKDKPTYDELIEGWKKWVPEIEEWQSGIDKPVIFPEVGYRSSSGAARQPWEHSPGPRVDLELQVDCYKAMVDTFWSKNWFYGVYWWNWGTDVRMGGRSNRGFTLQNKPVQDYVEGLYKGKR
ncbi:MAG: hypothetical protein NG740_04895 [Omnitrophica bacterium]|nr:hypothetical protein [Candidatus Omnitrophota bacterium]